MFDDEQEEGEGGGGSRGGKDEGFVTSRNQVKSFASLLGDMI